MEPSKPLGCIVAKSPTTTWLHKNLASDGVVDSNTREGWMFRFFVAWGAERFHLGFPFKLLANTCPHFCWGVLLSLM